MKLKKVLALILALCVVLSSMSFTVFAEEAAVVIDDDVATEAAETVAVAKVGNTEYATIDKAIAAWTNNTTLTLLADVTLSDVIKLSSTEYHILDLGTYTMTAAKNKDAIQYVINGRSTASYALDIKADATNPGGITATGKTIVSHIKPSSGAPEKDRPITRFYGGVFNASYVVKQGGTNSWGFLTNGYTGASAPYFYFYGGEYNGTIYTNRSQNQFHGGTFNGSMQMSVDSSAYTMVAGGTFKNLSNSFGSTLNSDKFVIGTSKGANNGSVCIDENGYYVVTSTTPSNAEASVASNYNNNNYFYYSTVNTNGMYYEDVYMALEKNTSGTVTVYTDELDMSNVSNFKGTIVVPEGAKITIIVAAGKAPTWTVSADADDVIYTDDAGNELVKDDENGAFVKPAPVEVATYEDLVAALEKDNANIIMTADITATATQSSGYGVAGIVLNAGDVLDGNGYTLTIEGTNGTYDCVVAMKGGTVKNLTVKGAFRGIFMPGANGDVIIDNCVIEDVVYTFNSDAGSKDYAVTITNTTLNGWTSFSDVHKSVAFENCTFGEGRGYAFCRPYQATTFTGCEFSEDMEIDATVEAVAGKLVFDDCTYAGAALSEETAAPLFSAGGTVVIDDETVEFKEYVPVAKNGDEEYATLEAAVAAAKSGDTITLLADTTVTADVTLPAGITFNGNGYAVEGNLVAGGDLTFEGHTKVTNFNAGYGKPTITIGEGACLELTGTGRMVIGHGATFNITGNITDAKTANTAGLTPSLIAPGASFTGAGVTFNVKNAYVKFTAYCSSKNSAASGTHNFNVDNSVWEQSGSLVFSEPTNGMDPTFNFNLKDSVLNSTSHLVFAVTKGEIVFDNSNVNNENNKKQLENRSNMTIKNGSVVYASVQTSSNAKNPGTTTVDNSTYVTTGTFGGADVGTGTLVLKNRANFTTGTLAKVNATVDATSLLTATKADVTTTTVTVDGMALEVGDTAKVIDLSGSASIEGIVTAKGTGVVATYGDDGDVTITKKEVPVASVTDAEGNATNYTDLSSALQALKAGDTLEILSDITITEAWNSRSGNGGTIKVPVTIDGGNHTIKFACDVQDGNNYHAPIRAEADIVIKNLTLDLSEASNSKDSTRLRALAFKASATITNCTFIGNTAYTRARGICFGEGAAADALSQATVSITDCYFKNWSKGIIDNESGKREVKSVSITGSTFESAGVNVSASESITFTGNTVSGAYVDLRSYTDGNKLNVTATDNNLTANTEDKYNYIKAGGTVNAQEGFIVPWDGVTITNLDELKKFRDAVNNGDSYAGKTVTLNGDIDLAGENWTPIGTINADHGFMGNFDGQNHKIMNLTITNPALDSDGYAYAGLFGITEGIDKDNQNSIKNLTIENVTINTTGHIVSAAIAYPYYTIVDNVKVCGKISISGGDYTAGVLAYTRRCIDASNLSVVGDEGSTISGEQTVGGVISDIQMNGGLTANYSNFNVSGVTIAGEMHVGGISGIISEQALNGATVSNVTLVCDDARVGTVAGSLGGAFTITNVTVENVTGTSSIVGADYGTGKVVEAKIGDKYYATLEDALKANVEGEITLLAPIVIEAGETLELNKAVTINYTSNVPGEDMITNRGNLVIDGATLVYTNTDTTAYEVTVSTISCEPGSVLEVKSGVVKNDSANNGAKHIYAFTIDLLTNGSLGDVTATISGGEVISTNYMAIRQFNNGDACENTLDVTDGYIYGAQRAIQIHLKNDAAYTTISGGKIEGGGYALCFFPENATHLTVSGGEFIGSIYSGTNGFISGGTFTTNVSDYVADGFKLVTNENGTYGVALAPEEDGFLDKLLVIWEMETKTQNGIKYYPIHVYAGIDSLKYKEVGFKVTAYNTANPNGAYQKVDTKTVYESMNVIDSDGEVTLYKASDLSGMYMFGKELLFTAANWSNADTEIHITPYAIDLKGKEITGDTKIITDAAIKAKDPSTSLFKEDK